MSKQTDLINIPDAITVSATGIDVTGETSAGSRLVLQDKSTGVEVNSSIRHHTNNYAYMFGGTNGLIFANNTGEDCRIKLQDSNDIEFITSSTNRMVIDPSGRVRMPYQPAFLAHGNSGSYYSISTLGGGSYISFANAVTNIGNCFNPSNSRFSAPVAGMYHFDVAVYTRTGTASEDIYPRWRVNNSSNKGYTYWWNTTGQEIHHTITDSINIYLNAGDDIGVTINGHSNSDIHLGFQESRFSGYLLG